MPSRSAHRIIALAVLSGCATAPPQVAPPPPAAAASDLSGDWISGFGEEPRDVVVHLTRPCGETVTTWRLTHVSGEVVGILVTGASLTGVPHNLPVAEQVGGQADSTGFHLQGTEFPGTTSISYTL